MTDPVVKDSNATYTPGISERRSGTTKLLSQSLKSVDSQTTTSQSVAASKVYDAFGNVTSSTGTFVGPFGYGGGFGYQEEATGWKLLGHRLYNPSTGRFQKDNPKDDHLCESGQSPAPVHLVFVESSDASRRAKRARHLELYKKTKLRSTHRKPPNPATHGWQEEHAAG